MHGFYLSVVVEQITPNYYAAGVNPLEYFLTGRNFTLLQGLQVKGILSNNNDDPLHYRAHESMIFQYVVEIIDDTQMRLTHGLTRVFDTPTYLGAILSQNGEQVYWVNNTAPLP